MYVPLLRLNNNFTKMKKLIAQIGILVIHFQKAVSMAWPLLVVGRKCFERGWLCESRPFRFFCLQLSFIVPSWWSDLLRPVIASNKPDRTQKAETSHHTIPFRCLSPLCVNNSAIKKYSVGIHGLSYHTVHLSFKIKLRYCIKY